MSKLANFSGNRIVKILQKNFSFIFVSQKGSHVKLRKIVKAKVVTVIIPRHSELAVGTLKNILRQAQIEVKEFLLICKK